MQEKLNQLKNNSLLEISNWWGLHESGKSGTIITQDKMIYHYTLYSRPTKFLTDNNIPLESLSKGKTITEEEYLKVIQFIKKEILGKDFISNKIFDAGWIVSGNYQGTYFNIPNNISTDFEKGIYDKAKKLINEIKGE